MADALSREERRPDRTTEEKQQQPTHSTEEMSPSPGHHFALGDVEEMPPHGREAESRKSPERVELVE